MASRWSLVFLCWYICVLCVQPQNRFVFLHPFRIADICVAGAVGFHFLAASERGRPFLRMGPATITALLLMFFSFISLHIGPFMPSSAWNSDIDIIYKNSLVLILVEAMAFNVKRVWMVQMTLMFSTLWWVKGGLRLSGADATYSGDRIMGPAVSLIENPNGFAYMMTVMIPLYLYLFQTTKHKVVKWGFLALALMAVWIVLETGSRTGLLALIAVGVFLLPKYGSKYKGALSVAAIVIFLFTTAMGSMNVERFKSIPEAFRGFMGSGEEEIDPADMTQDQQSAYERRMKNKHTLNLILQYPLFGVGLQSDDERIWDLGDEFSFATGQVHNEILYAGKQMGIIGMGLYLSFLTTILMCGLRVQRATKSWWPDVSDLGWTFKMQALVFAVGGFFSPIPWNPLYLIIAGSASALLANIRELGDQGHNPTLPNYRGGVPAD